MGLDFVDGQVSCLPVWFPEYALAIGREFGVKPLQAALVYALDSVLMQPREERNPLVRVTALQKVFDKRFQL
jgi:hypothetical protein